MKVCQKCYTEVEDHTRFCPNCGTQIVDESSGDDNGLVGRTLAGKFLLKEEIGAGAMGKIYRAEQINLGRTACIKVLHPHLMGDPTLSKRFHREARAASRLKHPNCINVIDFGIAESDNIHYIAMEFLDGRDLAHIIRDEFPLDPVRIIHLGQQICAALDEAHEAEIIHRDLKPENVFVEDRRHAKDFVTVLDFGIAKIKDRDGSDPETFATMAGVVCGTPEYMSPEQARGDPLDARSDLYAFGVILFHMITGRVPFTGDTPIGIVTKHLTDPPPRIEELNPTCHPQLVDLTNRLLSKDKELRPRSAMAVKRELDRIRRTIEEETDALSMTAPMARPEALTKPQPHKSQPTAPMMDPDSTQTSPGADHAIEAETQSEFDLSAATSGKARWFLLLLVLAALGGGGWYLFDNFVHERPSEPTSEEESPPANLPAADLEEAKDLTEAPDALTSNEAAAPDVVIAPESVGGEELPATEDIIQEVAPATPDIVQAPDIVDPLAKAREQATERIAALTGVLAVDKNLLVARQGALVQHEANWLAKETADTIQVISGLETRVTAVKAMLAEDLVDKATETLELLKAEVKETHDAAAGLLEVPIPTREEVAAHEAAEDRLRSLEQTLDAAGVAMGELTASLEAKRGDWAKVQRSERVATLAGELETLADLKARHLMLREALKLEEVEAQTQTAKALAKERDTLSNNAAKLLKARVRSKADEEAERKQREDAERERKKDAERKRKEEEEKTRKAQEAKDAAAAKAAAKAKAEAQFSELSEKGDAARSTGSYAAAIGLYKQALKLKDSSQLRKNLGKAYNSTGQYGKAAEQFEICIKRLEARLDGTADPARKEKLQGQIDLLKSQIRK